MGDIYLAHQEGTHMALKLATVGIGLAIALTLLTAMTWATAWPAFRPVLMLVY
jgi:hypothetical protein